MKLQRPVVVRVVSRKRMLFEALKELKQRYGSAYAPEFPYLSQALPLHPLLVHPLPLRPLRASSPISRRLFSPSRKWRVAMCASSQSIRRHAHHRHLHRTPYSHRRRIAHRLPK